MNQKPDGPRAAAFLFKMSRGDHAALKRRAAEDGTTIQGYLERVVFGLSGIPREAGRPVKHSPQRALEGLEVSETMRKTG